MSIPGIMIAAPKSGSGKTTITCAILSALKSRGVDVAAFKCGPDYIDPMFHREIIGVKSRNLDLFFTDADRTRALFEDETDCDMAVIEGVMGLYDGLGGVSEEASSYALACALNKKIVLVVDVHGMGRSVLAYIKGFLDYDTEGRIAGLILNRVSPMFYKSLRELIEEELKIRVVGYYPDCKESSFESRYLGLRLPGEIADIRTRVEEAGKKAQETIDLDLLLELAGVVSAGDKANKVSAEDITNRKHAKDRPVTIGVAYDAAFCFYYEDNLRRLEKSGANLVFFSPLKDKAIPDNVDGLLLGGGYPELYAKELMDNEDMKKSIAEAIGGGMPSLAECGGFMYLHKKLVDKDGESYDMCGVIDGSCTYAGKLVRFGYVSVSEKSPCWLSESSEIRGHEFHYYDSDCNGSFCLAKKPVGGKEWEFGHVSDRNFWGFAHMYYESCPEFAEGFVRRCKEYRRELTDGKLA